MSNDSTPQASRRKCANCGLVNAGADEQCRRCGAVLPDDELLVTGPIETDSSRQPARRSLLKRLVWIISPTLLILIVWYVSLLMSSNALPPDQRLKVDAAISLLEQTGFNRE